jgi:hypothetical protein
MDVSIDFSTPILLLYCILWRGLGIFFFVEERSRISGMKYKVKGFANYKTSNYCNNM